MRRWRSVFELDEINSGIRYHCIPITRETIPQLCVGHYVHGNETWPVTKKMRWHFRRQR